MNRVAVLFALILLASAPAHGTIVAVDVLGQVTANAVGDPPLGNVDVGDGVVMSFTVDSNDFVDGIPGDTRGYAIDPSSFELTFIESGVHIALADPAGTPYFTVVDGFPVSDGFFVSSSPLSPGGVPLAQDPYQLNLDLGYEGEVLSSLDILDAVGVYDFTDLTRFAFNIWALSPDNTVIEIDFSAMAIQPAAPIPVPGALWLLISALLGTQVLRRRPNADRT